MEKHRKVICERCAGEIESKEDLVTTLSLFTICAYHNECYANEIKGMRSLFVSNVPINGTYSTFGTILLTILLLGVVLFLELTPWVILLSLFFIGTRLYSYLAIERVVENREKTEDQFEREKPL